MRLTTQSEYALLVLLHLARAKPGEYVSLSTIAEAQDLPLKYVEHLVQILCREGYLASQLGVKGGYRLERPASAVSIASIIRLFDGPLAPTKSVSKYFYQSTPIEKEKKLLGLMRQIRNYVSKKLEATTLKDIA